MEALDADTSDQLRPWTQTGTWGHLPTTLRVLFITGTLRAGNWLAKAFHSDAACEVSFEHVVGLAAGLARLRDEVYDVVLLQHDSETLDAPELLGTVRTAGHEDQAILVLGYEPEEQLAAACYEAGADGYVCLKHTTTRMLLWKIAIARERHLLLAENRRLRQEREHQLVLEQEEASRLIAQQRQLLVELLTGQTSGRGQRLVETTRHWTDSITGIPPLLATHYRELLRTYVIMGSGNLGPELHQLAELFAQAALGPFHVLHIHIHVVEEMIRGLGTRSARHVMNRADLLVLETVIHLAEAYRRRCLRRQASPQQLYLPGCDPRTCWTSHEALRDAAQAA